MQNKKILTGALALALSIGVLAPQVSHAAEEGERPLPEGVELVEGDGSELTWGDLGISTDEEVTPGTEGEGTIEAIPEEETKNKEGQEGSEEQNIQVNPDTSKSDDDKRDMKPSDLKGKKPGEGEEWVDDDYVDSNKTPAKSLDELKKDPNAVEVENKKDKDGKEIGKSGESKAAQGQKGFGVVKAQTGGAVTAGVAGMLAAVAGAYSLKRKK